MAYVKRLEMDIDILFISCDAPGKGASGMKLRRYYRYLLFGSGLVLELDYTLD